MDNKAEKYSGMVERNLSVLLLIVLALCAGLLYVGLTKHIPVSTVVGAGAAILALMLFAAARKSLSDCIQAQADASMQTVQRISGGINDTTGVLRRVVEQDELDARLSESTSVESISRLNVLINKVLDLQQQAVATTRDEESFLHERVEHLLQVMETTKAGDLSARAEVDDSDTDIARLSRRINEMIDNFQEVMSEMEGTSMDLALSLSENFEVLNKVSEGDLTLEVTGPSQNELMNKLAEVVNRSVVNLRDLIGKLSQTAGEVRCFADDFVKSTDQVRQGAQQIALSVQDMARGSENQSHNVTETSKILDGLLETIDQIAKGAAEQAKSVEQTSVIVNEMSGTIESTVSSLQQMIEVFHTSMTTAESGRDAVANAINNITQLSATVEQTALIVENLGESSKRISDITEVIDDIAEQTNLLALNAAIEAGRAGEHGKGFAVVAAEIRKLAERSVKATKQIAQLIEGVQENTNKVVQEMRVGTERVEQGARLGEEARLALADIMGVIENTDTEIQRVSSALEQMVSQSQKIVEAMDAVASIVEENTAATEEMAASSKQVEESMRNVLSISEDNAAATQEISASTEEQTASVGEISSATESLSGMARELEEITQTFTL